MNAPRRTLVFGFGNPGRGDDGLGPALAAAVAELGLAGVDTDADYQLSVEDAATASRRDRVVFVDAAAQGPAPFALRRIEPGSARPTFSSHHVSPEGVLALARELFDAAPEAWLLAIRGYDFDEFREGLSDGAQANLAAAIATLHTQLTTGEMACETEST
ncbi:MAG: hydrogenase maturation protease [Candidatus Krumholzibacteriia bacterium]|nr:hydrogenase maturation protease [Candidatus Latescibacterota bacterium]MCB9517263.1 hydrogenase maturation protease [Candidatus Latescibacterota bacterium]